MKLNSAPAVQNGGVPGSALKAGETDMMLWIPPDNLPDLESSGFVISMNDGPYVEYWYLNFKNDITAINRPAT